MDQLGRSFGLGEIGCRDPNQISARNREFACLRPARVDGDQRLPLRGARRDGRPFDGKVLSLEVDVVQLVPIDESSARSVTYLGVVLPAVPQPTDHLDSLGRFLPRRLGALHCLSAEQRRLLSGVGHRDLPAGPPR